jgi:prephenate dehydrogenase
VPADAPLRPPPAARLVVVGLGLVGGSVARAVRVAAPTCHIVGVDRVAIVEVAAEQSVIDAGVDAADHDAVDVALRAADLVVLAVPVLAVVAFLRAHTGALAEVTTTDTGSTKRAVVDAAHALGLRRFVGGHPMAGKSSGGLRHANAQLFERARWFLCVGPEGDATAVAAVRTFVSAIGALPVELDAAEHDRDVALTSHLPHLLVNALAEAVLAAGATDAAGGSLRDVLKVAGAPFDVWGDTITTNGPAIAAALDDLIDRLARLKGALGDNDAAVDRERFRDLFAHGRALRERLHG